MKFINKFFFELTRRNWGWSSHVILADIGAAVVLFGLFLLKIQMPFLWHFIMAWLIVSVIGYINEAIQKEKRLAFWEDILANNLGIILGGVKAYLIYSLFN